MNLFRNQNTIIMKKSLLFLFLSLFFYPFLSIAQNPQLEIEMNSHQCDSTNNFDAATGCDYWLSNSYGDTVYQDVVPSFTQNWAFSVPYNSAEAPYHVNFDNTCLNSHGVALDVYSLQVQNIHPVGNDFWADSVMICESTPSNTIDYYADIYSCDTTANDPMANAAGCNYWVEDGNGSTVYQNTLSTPSTTQNGSSYSHFYDSFNFVFDSSSAPYSLHFDESCLLSHGVTMDLDSILLNESPSNPNVVHDSLYICANDTTYSSITYEGNISIDDCYNIAGTDSDLAAGCNYWVEDGNGSTVLQNTISNNGSSSFIGNFSFQYDSLATPYTLNFDQNCLNSNGLLFDNYTIPLDSTIVTSGVIHDEILICAQYDSTAVNDSCADLYSNVGPWIGYYQNYTNFIKFKMGNNSNTPQSVIVEIVMPPGVTPVPSSFDYPYTVSGSILTLNATFLANTNTMDIIKFNVPGGISDGTLHTYGINIYNNDPSITDCFQWNNQDTLHQIVGNSYDPNAKTINLPEQISSEMQDEFIYTVYFQNTGTAPAQDIYIMDTLSDNLDWSTFEFLRSSHVIGISDLGNGVKKFYFDDIWLPDSTSNLAESNGFLSFKIKEKASNTAGTEVLNTAYIFFDQNAPIVTNTTYNINVDNLGLEGLNKKMNVKLFPNPANASINIEAENRIDNIEIHTVDGKLCWSSKPNQSEVKLNISDFNSGLYLVNIQSQESTRTLRFIKK